VESEATAKVSRSTDPRLAEEEGLSDEEAARRLATDGPNALPEAHRSRLLLFLEKFWGPVPWLLEAAIVLELALGNDVQAAIIAVLVAMDAVLSYREEGGAEEALRLLTARLQVEARVLRNRTWTRRPARELVVGDVVHLRQGDLVPADIAISAGTITLDQSTLTGESRPVSADPGKEAYSGSTVVRGEATGRVSATGARTRFGRTAELVETSRAPGRLEQMIMGFVSALLVVDVGLVALVLVDGALRHLAWGQLLPFAVILLVAAVPVALPTTFTLASALGSRELSDKGVLVTRLAAIEEAASMEVLCSDKTGTITENRLALSQVVAYGCSEDEVVRVAAAASDQATEDPLDVAILQAAADRRLAPLGTTEESIPFDPATKRAEATVATPTGRRRVVKGAPAVVLACVREATAAAGDSIEPNLSESVTDDVTRLGEGGARVLGVAAGPADRSELRFLGLVALADPPRSDSSRLVARLHALGVRVVMVTGDGLATARSVAQRVGIGGQACSTASLRDAPDTPLGRDEACDVYAEVLPEDKLTLVRRLQRAGVVTGMTGDGVNDAPALHQAEVGIAVASATDVAKAAASMVLTEPGLENVVAGVEVSRRIHERMLTYTLNKITKTLQVSLFLSLGLVVFGQFGTTPLLVVLLLLANNFATMSLATDRVSTPTRPERWGATGLVLASASLALPLLGLSFAVWYVGRLALGLDLGQLQTLIFVWLVTSAQATIYAVRERQHFWHSRPSGWLAASSIADLLATLLLAWRGWLMASIGPVALGVAVGAGVLFLLVAEVIKTGVFRLAGLSRAPRERPRPLRAAEGSLAGSTADAA
jgi:H+-transporting ATPase